MTITQLAIALVVIFVVAKLFGELAERIGQPAVLGEMVGGIVIGVSGLQLLDAHDPVIHLLSELGVLLLLFLIGLETDVMRLVAVGHASILVAFTGVLLPFVGGYAAGRLLGFHPVVSVFLGAALTATSVGITARVLSDLGQLESDEAQVILGAAVLDDIFGLVLLSVVSAMVAGQTPTAGGVARTLAAGFGFVALAIVLGSVFTPPFVNLIARLRVAKALFFFSLVFALGFAVLADLAGSAFIIGAFAAGLVLGRTDRGEDIEREVHGVAQFFIPVFFVSVGAAVDLRQINPFDPAGRRFFFIGLILTVVAIAGKVIAGYAALARRRLRRVVIGVGMIPRGEVGLIFAEIGLSTGLVSAGVYSSLALTVMITTFIAPPLLRGLIPRPAPDEPEKPQPSSAT